MGGGISSNLHAVFFEIDDVLTKDENKNSLEIDLGDISGEEASKVGGCSLMDNKFTGGDHQIMVPGMAIEGECSKEGYEKILDNEKYFSTCFLVPKNIKVNDNGGMDISNKCKLVYKTEIKCEGDDTEEDTEDTTEETTEETT